MNQNREKIARTCMQASYSGEMSFPEIVGTLEKAGFESYAVDFRRATAVYYCPDGDAVALATEAHDIAISSTFDIASVHAAIREAQQSAPGYTYRGFCEKVMRAGCVGYVVSFPGRRAVYSGRTAEMHVEHFPQQ
jgi:uncharacterized protein YbcV (DUF1398 family)